MTYICVCNLSIVGSDNGLSPVNSPHKGQWRGALMFCLICTYLNGWVNTCEAGDLRRYCAHYDAIVMIIVIITVIIIMFNPSIILLITIVTTIFPIILLVLISLLSYTGATVMEPTFVIVKGGWLTEILFILKWTPTTQPLQIWQFQTTLHQLSIKMNEHRKL